MVGIRMNYTALWIFLSIMVPYIIGWLVTFRLTYVHELTKGQVYRAEGQSNAFFTACFWPYIAFVYAPISLVFKLLTAGVKDKADLEAERRQREDDEWRAEQAAKLVERELSKQAQELEAKYLDAERAAQLEASFRADLDAIQRGISKEKARREQTRGG